MRAGHMQTGFTLVEVLVALVILCVGLLGLAGLHLSGLRNNESAYLRSQATLQAYDMVDRMRANLAGLEAGGYDVITALVGDPGCISVGCTPLQMAAYDAFEWNTANAGLLPSGSGTVTGAGTGSVFTVTVAWDDTKSGSADTRFVVTVRP